MPLAVWSDPEQSVVVREVERPSLAAGQVRVATSYSYISAGTELRMLRLSAGAGEGPAPRKPIGYSLAGRVLEVGEGVTGLEEGQAVACVGAGAYHAEEVVVGQNLVVPIPEGVSQRAAATSAMMCFALEGVRKAAIEFGENLLVIGAGLMGQYASQLALASGARVFMMDLDRFRLSKAVSGVETLMSDETGWSALREATAPVGLEAVLVCAGGELTSVMDEVRQSMVRSPEGVQHGRVVFSGGATVTIPFASPSGNIRFLSSAKAGPGYRDAAFESGQPYPRGYVRWPVYRNVAVLLRAVARGQLTVEPLITHEYAMSEAPSAYRRLADGEPETLAVVLRGGAAG